MGGEDVEGVPDGISVEGGVSLCPGKEGGVREREGRKKERKGKKGKKKILVKKTLTLRTLSTREHHFITSSLTSPSISFPC